TSRAAQWIPASPELVYAAFTDPAQLADWLPPGDMTGIFHSFDLRVGGGYSMSLRYPPGADAVAGKTAEREDRVNVRFLELSPPHRVVEAVGFVSDQSAFHGEMTITVRLEPAQGGTEVMMLFENLPPGLRPEDNDHGAKLSLQQLAVRFALPPREKET
ncbi:MAG: SRPBCC domain-containing protein, partial [Allosphingosinicella sp.]